MTKSPPAPPHPIKHGSPYDAEIVDPVHDLLLLWLIKNLAECVDFLYGRDSHWMIKTIEAALKEGQQGFRAQVHNLAQAASHRGVPPDVARALRTKLTVAPTTLGCFDSFKLPPVPVDLATAKVEDWQAQRPLLRQLHRGDTRLVGFVDVLA